MPQYIVVNRSYGGFNVEPLLPRLRELGGYVPEDSYDIRRDNKQLVQAVRELTPEQNPDELEVVEIPDGVEWEICNYDGAEWVAEKHRRW